MASLTNAPEGTSRRSWLKRLGGLLAGGALLNRTSPAAAATGQQLASPLGFADCYIGEIMMISFGFAPRGWALCNGQLLPINQNQALFALLGVQYGGNGQTTFALPDLRGCVPVGQGQGPGLSNYQIGQLGGEESHQLTIAEIPPHTHSVPASTGLGTTNLAGTASPLVRNSLADSGSGSAQYHTVANATLGPNAVQVAGGGQSHENRQPFLGVHFVICLQGVFPNRS